MPRVYEYENYTYFASGNLYLVFNENNDFVGYADSINDAHDTIRNDIKDRLEKANSK